MRTLYLSFLIGFLSLNACSKDLDNNARASLENSEQNTQPTIAQNLTQVQLNEFADQLDIDYQIISTQTKDSCNILHEKAPCFRSNLYLKSKLNLNNNNWAIYFSHYSPIHFAKSNEFTIERIQGDLHRLEPTAEFTGFETGKEHRIELRSSFWHLSESDLFPNYYIDSPGLKPTVIKSTEATLDADSGLEITTFIRPSDDPIKNHKRTAEDKTPLVDAKWMFDKNASNSAIATARPSIPKVARIIPSPQYLKLTPNKTSILLNKGIQVSTSTFPKAELSSALSYLKKIGIYQSSNGFNIVVEKKDGLSPQAYSLTIDDRKISIEASSTVGVNYALYSLAGLWDKNTKELPQLVINDKPRYDYRGLHLDIARNFHGVETIEKLLTQMAALKLNRLHLHMGDDEGWRLEIQDLPELTEIGAKRCHDLSEQHCLLPQIGSGPYAKDKQYLTMADYRNIVSQAGKRNIEIIPSFDAPGHSRAAVKAMEVRYQKYIAQENPEKALEYRLIETNDSSQYLSIQHYNDNTLNPCIDSTYRFFTKVVTELAKLHSQAGYELKTYHIGADETEGAWEETVSCKSLIANNKLGISSTDDLLRYFITRAAAILSNANIQMGGWNDGLKHVEGTLPTTPVLSYAWTPLFWKGHEAAHRHANLGWKVIVASPDVSYFDFPYEADPKERGFYWASRHSNTQKVFQFMPDNLAAHAEIWNDRNETAYTAEDIDSRLNAGAGFYGLQAQLWTEVTRSQAQVECMLFPRLFALAERAWYKAPWELAYNYQGATYGPDSSHFSNKNKTLRDRDWLGFSAAMPKALENLSQFNIAYRLPTVGAKIEDSRLYANSIWAGLGIEYKFNSDDWRAYTGGSQGMSIAALSTQPTSLKNSNATSKTGTLLLRTTSTDKSRKGRSISIAIPLHTASPALISADGE